MRRRQSTDRPWLESVSWSSQPDGSEWKAVVKADRNGWRVEVTFVEQAGYAVPRELKIRPADRRSLPPLGITGRSLRRIVDLDQFFVVAQVQAAEMLEGDPRFQEVVRALIEGRLRYQVGRGRIPDEDYGRWARRYEELVQEGRTDPTKQLAHEEFVSRSTMANRLTRARKLGFLESRRQSKRGSHPR